MEEEVYDNIPGEQIFQNESYQSVGVDTFKKYNPVKEYNAVKKDDQPSKTNACSRNCLILLTLLVLLTIIVVVGAIVIFTWQFLDLKSKVDMIQLSSSSNQSQATGTYKRQHKMFWYQQN